MTAILAVRHGARVLVGSDRAISQHSGQVLLCGPKALRVGRYVVAVAGELGGHWEALAARTPATLGQLLADLGPGPDAEALVAQGSTIWNVSWDENGERWGACEVDGVVALGSGALCALGAWSASRGRPEARMRTALGITAKHIAGVSPPFDLIWTVKTKG